MFFSYTELRKEVNGLLKDYCSSEMKLTEHIIPFDGYTTRFFNFNPYKNNGEILPNIFQYAPKDEPDRYYNATKGMEWTGRILFSIREYKDYDLWADLFITCFINDYHKLLQMVYRDDKEAVSSLMECLHTAKEKLISERYGLWHHNCKEYFLWISDIIENTLFAMVDKKIPLFMNEKELAMLISNGVKGTFSKVQIVNCHYDNEVVERKYKEIVYAAQERILSAINEEANKEEDSNSKQDIRYLI